MAVLKMQRITICALKKNRKAILEKLQSLGVLEVNHILDEDEDFRKMDTAERKTGFEKAAAAVDQALDILEQYAPEKKSMFSALEGKKLISADEEMKVQEERRDLLRIARQIYDLDREHAEQQAAVSRLMNSGQPAHEQYREPDAVARAGCSAEDDGDGTHRILSRGDARRHDSRTDI